jgi:hypothetical protein
VAVLPPAASRPSALHAGRGAQSPGAHGPRAHDAFPELDCIRDRLSPSLRAALERRAAETGTGADRVLIAAGIIDEDSYTTALARWLGLDYETFDGRTRTCCPIDDGGLVEAGKTGLLPLTVDGTLVFAVAPRSVRQFIDYATAHPGLRFRLTTSVRLNRFIADCGRHPLGHRAAAALEQAWPHLSAASRNVPLRMVVAGIVALAVGALMVFPRAAVEALEAVLAASFIAWLVLRIVGSFLTWPPPRRALLPDHELPVYTIIAALYHEAAAVGGLVAALRQLDYPGVMAHTPQALPLPKGHIPMSREGRM